MAIDKIAQLAVDIVVNTRRARIQLNQFHGQLNKNTTATRKLGIGLGSLGAAVGAILVLRRAFSLVSDSILASVNSYVKLETQIVNVTKIAKVPIKELTTDFLMLGKTIGGVSFQEISDTMSAAARLGIRGSAGLAEFTKTAVILSQVSGDISSTAAAEGLGRLVKNFKLSTAEAENLASSIDALSDAFPTTSGQILTFSARLAGFAESLNVAAHELNAFGAFMLSTGLSSTVSRTAFVKFFNVLVAKPLEAAKALKLTKKEAKELFELSVTDPIRAFELFATAISKLTKPEQKKVLEDISAGSSRLQQAIFNAAGSIEKLNEALDVSKNAFEQSIQLIDKHAKAAGTAEARIVDMRKEWDLLLASLLETPAIVNTAVGALSALGGALGRGEGINFEEIILADTPEKITKQIKETQREVFKRILESEKLATSFPGRLGFNTVTLLRMTGELKQLEQKLLLLIEKRNKVEANIVQKKRDAATAAEDEKKIKEEELKLIKITQDALGKTILEDFRKENKQLLFNPRNDPIVALQLQIDKLNKTFEDTPIFVKGFAEATKQATDALKDQIKEEKAGKLDPFVGKFGQAANIADKMAEAINVLNQHGKGEAAFAVQRIGNKQIEALFNDKEPNRFVGLVEAWKKAQTAVSKDDQLQQDQLDVQNAMKDILNANGDKADEANNKLDLIEEHYRDARPPLLLN